MIFRIIGHKGLAMAAAFLNIVLAAEVLPEASSVYYLASFSFIQIMMAYAGFGVAHKLVAAEDDQAMQAKTWPWFLASILFGCALIVAQNFLVEAPHKYQILLFVCLALTLTVLSEWVRCAIARHSGFVIYNVMILCTAVGILITRDFSYLLSLFPAGGIVLLMIMEFRGIKPQGKLISPGLADILRAARVASVNQFYNVIISLFSLLMAGLPGLLTLILVYRFQIFFNWQSFYWLRFGHKKTVGGIDDSHRRENWKTIYLNIAALVGVAVGSGILVLFDLQEHLGRAFNTEFLKLLLFYATIRVSVNLFFPYELFLIYGTDLKTDLKLVGISLLTFILICAFAFYVGQLFWIIAFVEFSWLTWRIYSKNILAEKRQTT